jgi:hypothetical protein
MSRFSNEATEWSKIYMWNMRNVVSQLLNFYSSLRRYSRWSVQEDVRSFGVVPKQSDSADVGWPFLVFDAGCRRGGHQQQSVQVSSFER